MSSGSAALFSINRVDNPNRSPAYVCIAVGTPGSFEGQVGGPVSLARAGLKRSDPEQAVEEYATANR